MGTRDNESDRSVDGDTFQQWVRHTAKSREMTEQELLNQLVSAFWALDEMSDIGLNSSSDSGPAESDNDSRQGSARDRSDRDQATFETGTAERSEQPAPDPADLEAPEQLDLDDLDPRDDLTPAEVELTRRVASLRRQIADLSLDVEQQRSRQEEFTDRLSDDVTRLHSKLQSLDSRVDQENDVVSDRIDAIETDLEEVSKAQAESETWINEEFDQIEKLFEQLLDTVRSADDRVEKLSTTVSDVEQEREALDTLRNQAIRKGINVGQCENCGMTVDLSMLSEPSCPSCEKQFWDVEDATGWNPFSKPTLRTDGRPSRPPNLE